MMHEEHMSYPKSEKSKSFISAKIKKLMHEGKKKSAAVAQALSMVREMKKHG